MSISLLDVPNKPLTPTPAQAIRIEMERARMFHLAKKPAGFRPWMAHLVSPVRRLELAVSSVWGKIDPSTAVVYRAQG